jgi:hypothetical protein
MQLVVMFEDGGFFCSWDWPARHGLACRHYLAVWARRHEHPGSHVGVHVQLRQDVDPLAGPACCAAGRSPGESVAKSLAERRNRWWAAYLHSVPGQHQHEPTPPQQQQQQHQHEPPPPQQQQQQQHQQEPPPPQQHQVHQAGRPLSKTVVTGAQVPMQTR